MKKIKGDINKWRAIPCSCIGRFNIVKMSVLHNFIYRSNAMPVKIQAKYFVNNDKLI